MWLNILSIATGCFAVGFSVIALVKVKRDKKKAQQLLYEAMKLSRETAERAEKVGHDIEALIKELNKTS